MSFGSGFIIGQMLGNSNSSCQKHALEQENYELKRKNDELVQKMHILEHQLQEANDCIVMTEDYLENVHGEKSECLTGYLKKWGVK